MTDPLTAPAPATPSELNLDARFTALIQQRDNALNTSVIQYGDIADLNATIRQLQAKIVELQARIVELEPKQTTPAPPAHQR